MTDGVQLFELLRKLSEMKGLNPEGVGTSIGAELKRDDAASDSVRVVLAGAPAGDGVVASASLARPASALSGTASSLRLLLAPATVVTKEEVREAYGLEDSTIVPTPREPPDSPMALWYRRDWADVMFSFPPTENRLIGVVIDEREPDRR